MVIEPSVTLNILLQVIVYGEVVIDILNDVHKAICI